MLYYLINVSNILLIKNKKMIEMVFYKKTIF